MPVAVWHIFSFILDNRLNVDYVLCYVNATSNKPDQMPQRPDIFVFVNLVAMHFSSNCCVSSIDGRNTVLLSHTGFELGVGFIDWVMFVFHILVEFGGLPSFTIGLVLGGAKLPTLCVSIPAMALSRLMIKNGRI